MKATVVLDDRGIEFRINRNSTWEDFLTEVTMAFGLDFPGFEVYYFNREEEAVVAIDSHAAWSEFLAYGEFERRPQMFLRLMDQPRKRSRRAARAMPDDLIEVGRGSEKRRQRAKRSRYDADDIPAPGYDGVVDYDSDEDESSSSSSSSSDEGYYGRVANGSSESSSSEDSDGEGSDDAVFDESITSPSSSEDEGDSESSDSDDEPQDGADEIIGEDILGEPISADMPTAHVIIRLPSRNPYKKDKLVTLGPIAVDDEMLGPAMLKAAEEQSSSDDSSSDSSSDSSDSSDSSESSDSEDEVEDLVHVHDGPGCCDSSSDEDSDSSSDADAILVEAPSSSSDDDDDSDSSSSSSDESISSEDSSSEASLD